jgi:hypothetical protein
MSPVVETGVLIAATVVVGITLMLVPLPRQKPPEFDTPPKVEREIPTPQQVVAASQPEPQPQSQEAQLDSIEAKILHMQKQVTQMESKVEGRK